MRILSMVVGALCVALGVTMILFYRRGRIGAKKCRAIITEFERTTLIAAKDVTTRSLKVLLWYNGEQIKVTTMDTFSSKRLEEKLKAHYIGKEVTVYYNPQKPYLTTIRELWWNNDIWGILIILCGLIFLLAVI